MNRLILPLAALTLVACAEEKKETAPPLRSVRYQVVEGHAAAGNREFSGAVRAGNQSKLAFQVPGRVQEINVKVGDRVKKNQVIARLDPTDYQLQLAEAQASASQARAQAESAKATYARIRKLYENQNASRQDLDSARASKDGAQSALSAAYQAVKRLKRQLQYATLKAPGDGTIVASPVEANEVVGSATVIATLQVGEQLEVAVDVPETAINEIHRGDQVQIRVEAGGKDPVKGEVYEVGVPGQGGAVYPVTVRFDGQLAEVRAGMAAQVAFQRPEKPDDGARTVAASAVGEDRDGRFVFVVEGDPGTEGKVARRSVEVGSLESDGIRVLSGLKDGERVVTAGVSRLVDGLAVAIPQKAGDLR